MTLDDNVHAIRLRVMARAQAVGSVAQACRKFVISRSLFYRWRKGIDDGCSPDGTVPACTPTDPS
jgi:ACT domain-containing protein